MNLPDRYFKGYIYPNFKRLEGRPTPLGEIAYFASQPRHFIGTLHPFEDGQDVTGLWEIESNGMARSKGTPQKERVAAMPVEQWIKDDLTDYSDKRPLSIQISTNSVPPADKALRFTFDDIQEAVRFGLTMNFWGTDDYYSQIQDFAEGLESTHDL